jgi:hypothetical protein
MLIDGRLFVKSHDTVYDGAKFKKKLMGVGLFPAEKINKLVTHTPHNYYIL